MDGQFDVPDFIFEMGLHIFLYTKEGLNILVLRTHENVMELFKYYFISTLLIRRDILSDILHSHLVASAPP